MNKRYDCPVSKAGEKMVMVILCLILCAFLAACGAQQKTAPAEGSSAGQQTQEQSPQAEGTDVLALYAPVLDETADYIRNGRRENGDYPYLSSGVTELAGYWDREKMQQAIGYGLLDLNGDGAPELLIGEIPEASGQKGPGMILGGYTLKDGEPVRFLDGWVRSSYYWLGDGRFFYSGSSGAVSSAFGTFHISDDGTALVCENFCFTDVKDNNSSEIGVFRNTTGAWDAKASEELDMTPEERSRMEEEMSADIRQPELMPFGEYR